MFNNCEFQRGQLDFICPPDAEYGITPEEKFWRPLVKSQSLWLFEDPWYRVKRFGYFGVGGAEERKKGWVRFKSNPVKPIVIETNAVLFAFLLSSDYRWS